MSGQSPKRPPRARFVKLLFHRSADRGMRLIEHASRCVRGGEIHEVLTTDHRGLALGDRVDRVGFLGFVEFHVGGVVDRGDRVLLEGAPIGRVVGFDDCHFPNHYNVLIEASRLACSREAGAELGSELRFEPAEVEPAEDEPAEE